MRGDFYNENFNYCCSEAKLEDLRFLGNFLTWNNCSERDNLIACKLDKALVNDKWKKEFPCLTTTFPNQGLSTILFASSVVDLVMTREIPLLSSSICGLTMKDFFLL